MSDKTIRILKNIGNNIGNEDDTEVYKGEVRLSARNTVLDSLIKVLEEKKPLHIVLKEALDKTESREDRKFISRLTRGCVERALTLDGIINQYSKVKADKQKPVIRNILREMQYG